MLRRKRRIMAQAQNHPTPTQGFTKDVDWFIQVIKDVE